MARLTWSPVALADLQSIIATIARDSPMYAKKFGAKLRNAPKRLRRFPMSGWMVPEFGKQTIREIAVFPYRVIYAVRPGEVIVLAITHGARNIRRSQPRDLGDELV
jgi:plasmid stabilization system protein ParE